MSMKMMKPNIVKTATSCTQQFIANRYIDIWEQRYSRKVAIKIRVGKNKLSNIHVKNMAARHIVFTTKSWIFAYASHFRQRIKQSWNITGIGFSVPNMPACKSWRMYPTAVSFSDVETSWWELGRNFLNWVFLVGSRSECGCATKPNVFLSVKVTFIWPSKWRRWLKWLAGLRNRCTEANCVARAFRSPLPLVLSLSFLAGYLELVSERI